MPQWRKLHVKATESLDINDMPDDFHRLLWVMLPLGLDSEGRGLDNPAWIKAKIMPLRMDVAYEQVCTAFDYYASRGMIERYEVEGRKFFWVPTFKKYQGNTDREAESNFPPSPTELMIIARQTHDLLASGSSLDADADSEVDADSDSEEREIQKAENADQDPVDLLLEVWATLFPNKPQPKTSTRSIREKVAARWKDADFRENWHEALRRAARSPTLQHESWFDFRFFIKNDDNYQKCLDEWLKWKDDQLLGRNGTGKIGNVRQSSQGALTQEEYAAIKRQKEQDSNG